MKILMMSHTSNAITGGAARIMYAHARELTRQGHQVDLIFSEDVPFLGRRPGRWAPAFLILLFVPLWRLMRTRGPYDIVNIHTLVAASYVWLRHLFRWLPPCVVMSYGADELRWRTEREEENLDLKPIPLHSKLFYGPLVIHPTRYAIRHADQVVTSSSSEKEFFIREYGMDPRRVSSISSGVSEEFFISRHTARPPSHLLFLGGWEWRKGTRYLIEAFGELSQLFPHVRLSLVGTGEGPSTIKKAFPFNLQDRLEVLPKVCPSDLPRIYAEHDIFVFPSLFEGRPLVVLEAMASGMPVVTTKTCGMQDVIQDGVTGFLVPPRDSKALASCIGELLKDPALCRQLGSAAQRAARAFTWDRVAQQMVKVYEQVL